MCKTIKHNNSRYTKLTLGYVYMILYTEINVNSMNFVFFIVSVNILPIRTNIQKEQLSLAAPLSCLTLQNIDYQKVMVLLIALRFVFTTIFSILFIILLHILLTLS